MSRLTKRGLANVGLVLVILLGGMVAVYGTMNFASDYLTEKAKGESSFTATELVLLMDSIHAAPEGTTFIYNVPTNDNDYPVIGSLEIDTDNKKLCVHKHTEWEIHSTILSSALKEAGQVATLFAVSAARDGVEAYSLTKSIANTQHFKNTYLTEALAQRMSTGGGQQFASTLATNKMAQNLVLSKGHGANPLLATKTSSGYYGRFSDNFWNLRGTDAGAGQLKKLYSPKSIQNPTVFNANLDKMGITNKNLRKDFWTQKDFMQSDIGQEALYSSSADDYAKMAGSSHNPLGMKGAGQFKKTGQLASQSDDFVPMAKTLQAPKTGRARIPGTSASKAAKVATKNQQALLAIGPKQQPTGVISGKLSRISAKVSEKLPTKMKNFIAQRQAYKAAQAQSSRLTRGLNVAGKLIIVLMLLESFETDAFNYLLTIVIAEQLVKYGVIYVVATQVAAHETADQAEQGVIATILGAPPALVTRAARAVGLAFMAGSTTLHLDGMVYGMAKGSRNARGKIQEEVTCLYYSGNSQEVLGYPHNCQPIVRFGAPEVQGEVRDEVLDEGRLNFWREQSDRAYGAVDKLIESFNDIISGNIWDGVINFGRALKNTASLIMNFIRELAHILGDITGISDQLSVLADKFTPHATCTDDYEVHSTLFITQAATAAPAAVLNTVSAGLGAGGTVLGLAAGVESDPVVRTGLSGGSALASGSSPGYSDLADIVGSGIESSGAQGAAENFDAWIDPYSVRGTGCNLDIGQDCPNFYVSYRPGWGAKFISASPFTIITTGTFITIATAWPKPSLSLIVFIGSYVSAGIIAYQFPAQTMASIVTADVFPKEIKYQEVNGIRYNDNDGYYYMELPSAIQFSKVYFPEENTSEKRSRVVITKG